MKGLMVLFCCLMVSTISADVNEQVFQYNDRCLGGYEVEAKVRRFTLVDLGAFKGIERGWWKIEQHDLSFWNYNLLRRDNKEQEVTIKVVGFYYTPASNIARQIVSKLRGTRYVKERLPVMAYASPFDKVEVVQKEVFRILREAR